MEEALILIVIILLAFGVGLDDITNSNVFEEDVSVEEDKITGNEDISEQKQRSDSIYKIFKESITGNSRVNMETENGDIHCYFEDSIEGNPEINIKSQNGDIYVRFKEKIAGNARVQLETGRGDIHILFEEKILGNPGISLRSLTGDVIIYNNKSSIEKYISVKSGDIRYKERSAASGQWK